MLTKQDLQDYLKNNFINSPDIIVDCWNAGRDFIIDIKELHIKDFPLFCLKTKETDFRVYSDDYGATYWNDKVKDYTIVETINIQIKVCGFLPINLENTYITEIFR